MTVEEAQSVIEMFRGQGVSDENLVRVFYMMFVNGELNVEQFNALVNLLGYHLTEEFLKLSPKEQKKLGLELSLKSNKNTKKKDKDE